MQFLRLTVDARASAIAKLKPREQHDFVPLLLSGLSMPIESTFYVATDTSGSVHYAHSLYQEGPEVDWSVDANHFTMQNSMPGHEWVYRPQLGIWDDNTATPAQRIARVAATARKSQSKYERTAAAVQSQVSAANNKADGLNARIIHVLAATTGKNFETPRQWWDDWRDYNEYHSYDRPVDYRYYSGADKHFYGGDTISVRPVSCFVKGTPVWTKTGRRPIESLELGDLVIAQDVNTGELKYAPIIGRTIRPPSTIVKLSLDGEQVRTTRGHLFWVAATGWRMAKELEKGVKLYGLKGTSEIRTAESDGEAEAYNLVVADVGTYFVGEHGFLVHDNTPRLPTRAILPGVLAKK